MKKIIVIAITLVAFIGQSSVWAQEQGQIRAGAGLALGTKAAIDTSTGEDKMGVGITIGGDYFITDVIAIAPSYTFFFKSSFESQGFEFSLQASAFDVDGKYYFLKEGVGLYGLFGLSVGFAAVKTTIDLGNGPQTIKANDSEFGVNIGAGADYYINETVFLNGQLKYNTPLAQLAINIGAGFNIN